MTDTSLVAPGTVSACLPPASSTSHGRDRPILFSAPMVRAVLAGRKTQTRRVLKPQPSMHEIAGTFGGRMLGFKQRRKAGYWIWPNAREDIIAELPYSVGQRLWVREGGSLLSYASDHNPEIREDIWSPCGYRYAADGAIRYLADFEEYDREQKRPSIHMPRWASRLTLLVEAVRVERLQDITEEGARAEGAERYPSETHEMWWHGRFGKRSGFPCAYLSARESFIYLWDSLHGDGAWAANPWVVAITFRPVLANIDAPARDEALREKEPT